MRRLLLLIVLCLLIPVASAGAGAITTMMGTPADFNPCTDVAGCVLWLKADAIVGLNDGDAVGTWEDSSTANNDVSQSTADNKPSYQTNELNGKPVVRFDGANDILNTASAVINKTHSTFIVHRASSWGDLDFIMSHSGGANGCQWYYYSDVLYYDHPGSNNKSYGAATTDVQLVEAIHDDTVSTKAWLNGVSVGNTNAILMNTSTATTIGGKSSGSYIGDIAEIIVYSSALSDPNRQAVEDYLGTKYGITITH